MRCRAVLLVLAGCAGGKDSADSASPASACAAGPGCLLVEAHGGGLLSVRARAVDDVWVTGASAGAPDGPELRHFDGAAWTRIDTSAWPGAELWWAWVSEDEVVAVGSGGLHLELDRARGALQPAAGPTETTTFFGVWGASGDHLWAVGQDAATEPATAELWQRRGGGWSRVDLTGVADGVAALFKVHGAGEDDAWIVGDQGTALRWDGATWSRVATDGDVATATTPLLTVDAGAAETVAVGSNGNALLLAWDGAAWADRSPAFVPSLNGVCSHGPTAWAVGVHGTRVQRDAGAWVSDIDRGVDVSTREDWHACAVDEAGGLWTVGGRLASRPLTDGVLGYQGPATPPGW